MNIKRIPSSNPGSVMQYMTITTAMRMTGTIMIETRSIPFLTPAAMTRPAG